MRISRVSSNPKTLCSFHKELQSYVKPCFVNFWVIFGDVWEEIVFLKGLVKFGDIGNIKDLM